MGEGTFPNSKSEMDIDQSLFINNEAIEGGAIVFDSLTANVQNTVFQSNHAFVNAGALSTTNVVDTIANTVVPGGNPNFQRFTTTIGGCLFINNIADGNQAVHDTMFGGPSISGIDFALGGGALVTYMNGYMDISNSVFQGNHALHGDGGAVLNGRSANAGGFGAFAYDVQTTIKNSAFIGNTAPGGNGGAVASLRDPTSGFQIAVRGNTRMTINNSSFLFNSGGGNGGAMYFNYSTADFKTNSFAANVATGSGNAIYGADSIINGTLTPLYVTNN